MDIQVLRAVAIAAVVAFHFFPASLVSGFAGVDVFFVVSGFLITGLLLRDVTETSRVHLLEFWARRIRRIAPAALVVIVVVILAVAALGSSDQLEILPMHALGSAFSSENFVLQWSASDYATQTAATSPLEHYWSLAVEEQFYIVWPILVAFAALFDSRIRRATMRTIVVVVGLGSFAWAVTRDPSSGGVYFDSLARAWEIAAGAAVALWSTSKATTTPSFFGRIANRLAWIVLLISLAVPGLSGLVPGVGALPAVVATAIIIGFPIAPRTGGLVLGTGTRLLAWLGDRSYSVYLWHWPFLVLVPLALGRALGPVDAAIALLVVLVLADLSYRFIENPIRRSARPIIRRPLRVGGIALVVSAAVAFAAVVPGQIASGNWRLPEPAPAPVQTEAAPTSTATAEPTPIASATPTPTGTSTAYPDVSPFCDGAGDVAFSCGTGTAISISPDTYPVNPPPTPTCAYTSSDVIFDCILGDVTATRSIAVIGDSHAKALWVAFDQIGKETHRAVHLFADSNCAYGLSDNRDCTLRNHAVRKLIQSSHFDVVVLAQETEFQPNQVSNVSAANFVTYYADLKNRGIPTVVIQDGPHLPDSAVECLRIEYTDPAKCSVPQNIAYNTENFALQAAAQVGFPIIELVKLYCPNGTCPLAMGGMRVYRDYSHITTVFGSTLAPFIRSDLTRFGFLN